MTNSRPKRLVAGLAVLWLVLPATGAQEPETAEPQRSGLVEETRRRLAQLDVTVTGPPEAIRSLTREDFELGVGGHIFDEFIVDAVCEPVPTADARPAEPVAEPSGESPPVAAPMRQPVTYLFYFDQHHMTQSGRQTSLDTARDLIPRLIRNGDRASIVSAGKTLETFAETSDDPQELLAALDRLEDDRDQWDEFPFLEDNRVGEVLKVLRVKQDTDAAMALAGRYAREESWRTDKALRLFSTVLARLIDVAPPKATLYFADTMRTNPGEHYLGFFGQALRDSSGPGNAIRSNADFGAHPFDRVVEEASGYGIRIYTVQAQGLTNPTTISAGNNNIRGAGVDPVAHTRGVRDAQNSLVTMAAETGGESFINGVRSAKIAKRIREDMACVYLLSFDPGDLPEDEPLQVLLRVTRPKIQARVRGQIVLASEGRRRTSRLLSAFTAGKPTNSSSGKVEGIVIPTGFVDGKYTALVQISVPPSPLPQAEWDVGASLVTRGRVADDASGRIKVPSPGVPIVLEASMTFSPGPFELIMVAHDTATDEIISGRIESEWPDPDESRASLGPLVAMQPAVGAFMRDGEVRGRGALAHSKIVKTDRDLALIGIVCRDRPRKTHFSVSRRIVGDTAADFGELELEPSKDRCAQFRDLIPARTLTEGSFSYEVNVTDGDDSITSSQFNFVALEPETEANQKGL